MRFLSSDLFRNFGIGFALGAVLVVGVNVDGWSALEAPAEAAELSVAPSVPAPTAEFVIAPDQG